MMDGKRKQEYPPSPAWNTSTISIVGGGPPTTARNSIECIIITLVETIARIEIQVGFNRIDMFDGQQIDAHTR